MDNYIMVTGSAGFIGYSLALDLLKQGYNVIGIDNYNDYYLPALKEARGNILRKYNNFTEYKIDLSNYEKLEVVFKKHKFSCIVNLAAQAGVRYSITHPFVYEKSNVSAFLNILELVRHYNVAKLVYASSSSVYGGNKKIPFSESDPVDNPISLYAATKKANELMAHCYTHLYGFQSVGLRFFTVYGPWGRPDMAMWLFAEAMSYNNPIKVFNHGYMKRDFTYIDDIVSGVKGAIFSPKLDQYEIFNLGNHRTEQLMDMISIIEKELGIESEKEMLPMQAGDVPETFADVEKAKIKLGYEPTTPITIGIPKFISWFKENKHLVERVYRHRKS
jgi:UDP-glucuronate 4-epimerase